MNTPQASARSAAAAPGRRSSSSAAVESPDPAEDDRGLVADSDDPTGQDDRVALDDVFAELDELPDSGGTARAEYLPERRGYAVIRHVFVQHRQDRERAAERPSTLGAMVKNREFRAILLYLLILAYEPVLASNRRLPLRTLANMLTTAT